MTAAADRDEEQRQADWLTERGWTCWPPELAPRVHAAVLWANSAGAVNNPVAEEWAGRVRAEMDRVARDERGAAEGTTRHLRAVPGGAA